MIPEGANSLIISLLISLFAPILDNEAKFKHMFDQLVMPDVTTNTPRSEGLRNNPPNMQALKEAVRHVVAKRGLGTPEEFNGEDMKVSYWSSTTCCFFSIAVC